MTDSRVPDLTMPRRRQPFWSMGSGSPSREEQGVMDANAVEYPEADAT